MPSALTVTGIVPGPPRRAAPRGGRVGQQRRVDPVGEVTQLPDRLLDLLCHLVKHLRALAGIVGDHVPGQAQVHGERHQVLLGAVVQVPLHPTAFGVAGRHDPGPRFA